MVATSRIHWGMRAYCRKAITNPPTISTISPNTGKCYGGALVGLITITGTNFQVGATVTFKGKAATNITVVSSISITCYCPSVNVGFPALNNLSVDVTVTNPDGGNCTLTRGFTYGVFLLHMNTVSGAQWITTPTFSGGTTFYPNYSGYTFGIVQYTTNPKAWYRTRITKNFTSPAWDSSPGHIWLSFQSLTAASNLVLNLSPVAVINNLTDYQNIATVAPFASFAPPHNGYLDVGANLTVPGSHSFTIGMMSNNEYSNTEYDGIDDWSSYIGGEGPVFLACDWTD